MILGGAAEGFFVEDMVEQQVCYDPAGYRVGGQRKRRAVQISGRVLAQDKSPESVQKIS